MLTTAWAVPLLVSAAVGLVATPLARRFALAASFVDRPAPHKSHRKLTPYGGGLAIAVATSAGWLAGDGLGTGAIVLATAAVLAVVGLLDDDRPISASFRFAAELACGGFVLAAGIELKGVGVPVAAAVLTVLFLAGSANAINLLDNLDGLAAGVTAAGVCGVLVLAVLSHSGGSLITSAALLGACLAFLVFNARPASIFMGDAGSLFIGFAFATLAVRAGQELPAPQSLLFPLLLLGLPIADTSTVVLARLRNGRSPLKGGRDHLSHRLSRAGLGEGRAVAVLVAVEVVLAAIAVLSARGRIPAPAALGAGVVVLAVVVAFAGHVQVYSRRARGLPRALVLGLPVLLVVLAGLCVPAVAGALAARAPALAGEYAAQSGLDAAEAGDLTAAVGDFKAAHADFVKAWSELSGPLNSFGLACPVLSTNLSASRQLVSAGVELSALGQQLSLASDTLRYRIHGGRVPVAQLAATRPEFLAAYQSMEQVVAEVSRISHTYLLAEVDRAITRLLATLRPALLRVHEALGVATYAPALLGLNGPERYLLAMQTNSEQRASGGLIGFVGLLVADQGRIQLSHVSPIDSLNARPGQHRSLKAPADYLARYGEFDPADYWQNVNMSPDFPTDAAVMAELYPESGGVPVNGVVGIDPLGLASVLELTGPISVTGWPSPISAGNVAQVLLNKSYIAYGSADSARQQFLGRVVQSAFSAFSRLTLGDPRTLVSDLGPAILGHHIEVYSTSRSEEAYLASLGMTGSIPPVRSDFLELTTQSAAGNKIDYYLRRSIDYQMEISPNSSLGSASVSGQLTVRLDNTAPASGLPASVIGPYEPGFVAGENRSFVTVYTPLGFTRVTVNGEPSGLNSQTELGRNALSTFLVMPARSATTLTVQLSGTVRLLPGGWYELTFGSQPLIWPDTVRLTIRPSPGWALSGARGARLAGGAASATFSLDSTRSIWVRVARAS